MKNKTYMINVILAVLLSAALLAMVLLRTFIPAIVLPEMDIPNLVLISLLALLTDHYAAKGAKRCYICIALFSFVSFALLPFAAGLLAVKDALMMGVAGCVVFTIVTFLFTSVQDRLSSGPAAKAAPFVSALCMYCAAQGLANILL